MLLIVDGKKYSFSDLIKYYSLSKWDALFSKMSPTFAVHTHFP